MFDHSIAVLDSISRNLKKYLNITSIITQLLFMSYYAYLIVINVNNLYFLLAYSAIEALALGILIVDIIVMLSDLDHRARRVSVRTKRIIRAISWAVKMAVIVFNITLIVKGETSEAGKIFLIFSSVFLILQILLTVVSSLFSYYIDLFLYGLKLDYEALADKELASKRPVGKFLNKVTKDMDYRDKLNEFSIKHEVRVTIKKALESDYPLKINGKLVKKKKAEKIIIHYYNKANKYYFSHSKLKQLIEDLRNHHITYLTSDDHLYVLLFFANNHLSKNYKGLSEYALKLVIATLLFIEDGNDRTMVDLTFKAITKELFEINVWGEVIKEPSNQVEYRKVLEIIKETRELYKKSRDETIVSEIGDIASSQIEKSIDPDSLKGRIFRHVIKSIKNK